MILLSSKAADLWAIAVQTLHDDDKKQFDFSTTDRRAILEEILVAVNSKKQAVIDKRWRYTTGNGDIVIIRDVLEKITSWVNKFKEVGDIVVQYDPAHASLPWAAVRLLLQLAISDNEMFGAMAEGMEFVSNLIARYEIVERLYLRNTSTITDQLSQNIIKLYASVLAYLSKAIRYYAHGTGGKYTIVLQTSSASTDNLAKGAL
jgi:N-terminal domain of NWD NACHT-NTPase